MATKKNNSENYRKRPLVRYDIPTGDPRTSLHWESLPRRQGDSLIENLEDLKGAFQEDLRSNNPEALAVWSAVCGYCEALTTHKDPLKRFQIFPLPLDALRRLVRDEFHGFCHELKAQLEVKVEAGRGKSKTDPTNSIHREAVRLVSNAVWKKAETKSKNVRDELHANSLYVCFRGHIDKRSLDCFGAAVVTIAALHNVLDGSHSYCFLTLSEDHAYESHYLSKEDQNQNSSVEHNDNNSHDDNYGSSKSASSLQFGTCEIAIPGNTKDVQQTRGLEVKEALAKANRHRKDPVEVTPETSWLYMRKHPVICQMIPMAIAAVIGNVNCSIVEKNSGTSSGVSMVLPSEQISSVPLMKMKRELLWILHDQNHLSKFPFGLMELGECEEHMTTSRGDQWVDVSDLGIPEKVTGVEKLYLDAMRISKNYYGDAQTYPYFCAGHYHKDGVWKEVKAENDDSTWRIWGEYDPGQEYRLVEAVRLYSEASRVASQYMHDHQLMKHMTKAAMLIMHDILTINQLPRPWSEECNAIAVGTWLTAFYDSLLFWEESWSGKQFVEILAVNHKYSMEKMFQLLKLDIRTKMLKKVYEATLCDRSENGRTAVQPTAITKDTLLYFSRPRSKRLQKDTPLMKALGKEKVTIREMELAIPMSVEGGGRRAKRARR